MDSSANPEGKVVVSVSGKKASPSVKKGVEAAGDLMSDNEELYE